MPAQLVEEHHGLLMDKSGQLGRHDRVTARAQVVEAGTGRQVLDQIVLHHVRIKAMPALADNAELVDRTRLPGYGHPSREQRRPALPDHIGLASK